MKYVIVAVLDIGVNAFTKPLFVRTKQEALRIFHDEVHDAREDNQIHKHPADYRLFYLGEFDDGTGRFSCPELPEHMTDAITIINSKG